jgi:16S rRNA (adenine1518-N6/adenine1519-N6)-dimethyltransferase
LNPDEERKFSALVRAAFAHRRKTLLNSLRDEGYEVQRLTLALSELGIASAVRAETITLGQFIELVKRL